MPRQRYHLRVADVATARGNDPDLSFAATSPDELAHAVAGALRSPALFERWRAKQPEPDEVSAALGATDASAEARAGARAHDVDLVVTTSLPHSILRQRLNWLIGDGWVLADVKSA
jgi:hypothetical protein